MTKSKQKFGSTPGIIGYMIHRYNEDTKQVDKFIKYWIHYMESDGPSKQYDVDHLRKHLYHEFSHVEAVYTIKSDKFKDKIIDQMYEGPFEVQYAYNFLPEGVSRAFILRTDGWWIEQYRFLNGEISPWVFLNECYVYNLGDDHH